VSQATVFGGVSISSQIRAVGQGVDIVIATPGRLVDLIDRRVLSLAKSRFSFSTKSTRCSILGFIHAIRKITGLLPAKRQNRSFGDHAEGDRRPCRSSSEGSGVRRDHAKGDNRRARQSEHHPCRTRNKLALLLNLLEQNAMPRTLVFHSHEAWRRQGGERPDPERIETAAIHGNKSQSQRERALASFKSSRLRVLVATDIAARGIDIDGVSHVSITICPSCPIPMSIASAHCARRRLG